jgi:hypothetical protein
MVSISVSTKEAQNICLTPQHNYDELSILVGKTVLHTTFSLLKINYNYLKCFSTCSEKH